MQVSTANDVKVYNLSSGRTLPEWISDRKKRALLKNDFELRQRLELLQDFSMPIASTSLQVSRDGQYILAAGVYKPRIKCYDVNQLSMKFERCLDAEVVKFRVLSDDYSKLALLLSDRHLEFHAQFGYYYRTRIPQFGRDLCYHSPSCALYVAASGPEVYRLDLCKGCFLTPLTTSASACTACVFNPEHQLFTVGTEEGCVECWDPRSQARAGELAVQPTASSGSPAAVTVLGYRDALTLAVGTSTGHVMLYDLRSPRPLLTKDHHYGLPVHSLSFQHSEHLVLSADSKSTRIWSDRDGSPFTSLEPEATINELCHLPGSGLLLLATEHSKMLAYYIPELGPAPRWCSFLDSLTEELLQESEPAVYDDYKFVTTAELSSLGLSHLVGSSLLRAYMHGYFMDMRLYHKAKAVAQPFAYEEYRREKIKSKIDREKQDRVRRKKLPKVNKELAERLLSGSKATAATTTTTTTTAAAADPSNPLGDVRFSALFSDPAYQVDEESEEFRLVHPVLAVRQRRLQRKQQQQQQVGKEEEEGEETVGRTSILVRSQEDNSGSSSEGEEEREDWREVGRQLKARTGGGTTRPTTAAVVKTVVVEVKAASSSSKATLAERLSAVTSDPSNSSRVTSVLGSQEIQLRVGKSKQQKEEEEGGGRASRHRRLGARPAASLLPRTNKHKPVYWKGRRVK